MSDIESILSNLSEVSTKLLTEEYNPLGLDQNKKIAKLGEKSDKVAKEELKKNLTSLILQDNKEKKKKLNPSLITFVPLP